MDQDTPEYYLAELDYVTARDHARRLSAIRDRVEIQIEKADDDGNYPRYDRLCNRFEKFDHLAAEAWRIAGCYETGQYEDVLHEL